MTPKQIEALFSTTAPFSTLRRVAIKELAQFTQVHEAKRGEHFFSIGDPADDLWVVMDGVVAIAAPRPGGGCLSLEILTSGELFGISSLVDQSTYTADASAVSPTMAVAIPWVAARECLRVCPEFGASAVAILSQRVLASHAMRLLDHGLVEQRLANALLQLDHKLGHHLHMTRKDISEIAGTRLETTIRHLSQWRKAGILGCAPRGCIQIQDVDRLGMIAEQTPKCTVS